MINYSNLCSYSYVGYENTTPTETGLSKIMEVKEGSTCFPKTSSEKKHTQHKNAFVTGVAFNIELYSIK